MFLRVSRSLALVAAILPVSLASLAEWKPTKTVDIIVHTGPGAGSDLLARAVATMMDKEKLLPVRMNVINKPEIGRAHV